MNDRRPWLRACGQVFLASRVGWQSGAHLPSPDTQEPWGKHLLLPASESSLHLGLPTCFCLGWCCCFLTRSLGDNPCSKSIMLLVGCFISPPSHHLIAPALAILQVLQLAWDVSQQRGPLWGFLVCSSGGCRRSLTLSWGIQRHEAGEATQLWLQERFVKVPAGWQAQAWQALIVFLSPQQETAQRQPLINSSRTQDLHKLCFH